MSQRDISATIQDICGFELSQDKISTITDTITDDVKEWLNRPLKPLYSFVFVDCIYVKMKNERGIVDNHAVYGKRTCNPCYLRDCITALSLARQRI